MPYVTQSRLSPNADRLYRITVKGNGIKSTGEVVVAGSQTQVTTSFRTGGKQEAPPDDSTPTVSAGTFAYLQKTDREEGYTSFGSDDTGHTFHTENQYFRTSHPQVTLSVPGSPMSYTGPIILDMSSYSALVPYASQYIVGRPFDPQIMGPRAIQATIPTHPAASLAVALAELRREGLPHVAEREVLAKKSAKFRDLGSGYLNTEFGWKPFLRDLQQVGNAVRNSERLLRQFERDSGRNVRRKFTFQPETITTVNQVGNDLNTIVANTSYSLSFNDWYNYGIRVTSTGPIIEKVTTTRRCWFSGAYTYHAFGDSSAADRVLRYGQRCNALFGSGVTPEVVWNLAPWSWLADWYTNIGTNIANASAFMSDGLVLRYGYLMTETVTEHSMSAHVRTQYGQDVGLVTNTYTNHVKDRIQSTPYGFGVNQTDLTARQNAILNALRISFQRR